MARPTVKTDHVPEHVREAVLALFGTPENATVRLRLQGFTRTQVSEALNGYAVRPETAEALHQSWLGWCRQFLRGHSLGIRAQEDLHGFKLLDLNTRDEGTFWDEYLEKEREEVVRRLEKDLEL